MRLTPMTRCKYSQCMPLMHPHDLWTNTCGLLLVGVARAVGTSMNEQWCKKRKAKLTYYIERMWVCFWTAQNERIWSFLKTTTCFICFARHCCSLLCLSFWMRTSWHCGCIYTLSSLPFSCQAPSSSSLPSQFLPFWRHDNGTASAALQKQLS